MRWVNCQGERKKAAFLVVNHIITGPDEEHRLFQMKPASHQDFHFNNSAQDPLRRTGRTAAQPGQTTVRPAQREEKSSRPHAGLQEKVQTNTYRAGEELRALLQYSGFFIFHIHTYTGNTVQLDVFPFPFMAFRRSHPEQCSSVLKSSLSVLHTIKTTLRSKSALTNCQIRYTVREKRG